MNTKIRESYLKFLARYDLQDMQDVSPDELLYHIRANSNSDEDGIEAKLLSKIIKEGKQ